MIGDLARRVAVTGARVVPYGLRPGIARLPVLRTLLTRMLASDSRQVVTVSRGPLAGTRMEVDLAHEKAFWTGTHEPEIQRILLELVRPTDLAWDVGAHIGFFSLLLARSCRRVVAVEPHPPTAARLRRNVELNAAAVDVVEAAVAATVGTSEIELGPMDATHRLAAVEGPRWAESGPGTRLQVETTTLDELSTRFGPPDVLKLDVEGAEIEALTGGSQVLRRVRAVVCETHSPSLGRQTIDVLRAAGFETRQLDDHVVATR